MKYIIALLLLLATACNATNGEVPQAPPGTLDWLEAQPTAYLTCADGELRARSFSARITFDDQEDLEALKSLVPMQQPARLTMVMNLRSGVHTSCDIVLGY